MSHLRWCPGRGSLRRRVRPGDTPSAHRAQSRAWWGRSAGGNVAARSPRRSLMDGWNVIDADGHAMDYPDAYASYIDDAYKKRGSFGYWFPMEAYNRSMNQTLG